MLSSCAELPANISGHLTELFRLHEREAFETVAAATNSVEPGGLSDLLRVDQQGRPVVSVWTRTETAAVVQELEGFGATVHATSDQFHLIEASLDVATLPAIADLPGVLSLTPVYQPITRQGAVQTQGDEVIRADEVRDPIQFPPDGYDGSPFLIGAMSDSALNIAASQDSGDLPDIVDRYLECPADDEGRAMLEIIYDVAPGANLAHHSAAFGELSFAEGIRELAAAGSRIIVDDVGHPSEPFFQDGIIAQAVDEVVEQYDVIYVSAAGNYADLSYEAGYLDSGGAGPTEGLHDFDIGPEIDVFQQITLPVVSADHYRDFTIVLQWDQPFYTTDGVTSSFDLYLYADDETSVIASATDDNIALQAPIEVMQWRQESSSDTTPHLAIDLSDGDPNAQLKYVIFSSDVSIDEYATHSGTIVGHAAAAGAIAVGAVPWYDPDTIEPSSSWGNPTIYFDGEGNRLALPEVRPKPDVVAPDDVNTSFFGEDTDDDGYPNFSGTSAAAPHVAAAAALILDANPHLTRDELYEVLTYTAEHPDAPGDPTYRDRVYGYGLIDVLAAVEAALIVPDVTAPTAQLVSAGPVSGWNVQYLKILFSEPMEETAVTAPGNYVLIEAGPDGQFDTGDDVPYCVEPDYDPDAQYDTDARAVVLTPTCPATELDNGYYRLTLKGTETLTDPAGNPLNGGADEVIEFVVADRSQISQIEGAQQLDVRADGTAVIVYAHNPGVGGWAWPQIMVGQYDVHGQSEGPYRSVPTHMTHHLFAQSPDVALRSPLEPFEQLGGVIIYDDVLNEADPDNSTVGYELLFPDGRPEGRRREGPGVRGGAECRVDMNDDGVFALAFRNAVRGDDWWHVWAKGQLFDANGNELTGQFMVSQTASVQDPTVAIAPDGTTIYAWYSWASHLDGHGDAVFARRFDANGNPLGDEFQVNTSTLGDQNHPEVAVADDGSFVIVWQATGSGVNGVFLQRYDPSGNAVGDELRLSAGSATDPQVAMTPDGHFVVAWSDQEPDGKTIFAQRFNADGSPLGGPFSITDDVEGDQTQPLLGIRANGDFVVAWQQSGGGAQARWVSWDGSTGIAPADLWVSSVSDVFSEGGDSLNGIVVTFNKPVQQDSFTFDEDVELKNPQGINPETSGQVDPVLASGDLEHGYTQYAVTFDTAQTMRGLYRVTIGPNITDTSGVPMNEDGDQTPGEPADAYRHGVYFAPTVWTPPGEEPEFYAEDFDGWPPVPTYWAFESAWSGTVQAVTTGGPNSPPQHLHFVSNQGGSQSAVMAVDLSGCEEETRLWLNFSAKRTDSPWTGQFYVDLSGDGQAWHEIVSFDPAEYHKPYTYDLDQHAGDAGVTLDGDVYVRFRHYRDQHWNYTVYLDDVHIFIADDVWGPRVIAHRPTDLGPDEGPLSMITVTFNEPIKEVTFGSDDVVLKGPQGQPITVDSVGPVSDTEFTITFPPQDMRGRYRLKVGPNIEDSDGNLMNQDEDQSNGEAEDAYNGTIDFAPTVWTPPGEPPELYVEDFDGWPPVPTYWAFDSAWSGTVQAVTTGGPNSPPQHLQFLSPTEGGSQSAVMVVDLSKYKDATDLWLNFWAKHVGFDSFGQFYVDLSGDGQTWDYEIVSFDPQEGSYQPYTYDLDWHADQAGIVLDGDVYVRFRHYRRKAEARDYTVYLDDVRILKTHDPWGPRVILQDPTQRGSDEGPLSKITVTFDEPIDPETFEADDVELKDPQGQPITVDEPKRVPESGDTQFTITFPGQDLRGRYRLTIGPNIRDATLLGNLMNQDGDRSNGEPHDAYSGTIYFAPTVWTPPDEKPQLYVENFDGWPPVPTHWVFESAHRGTVEAVTTDGPHSPPQHLRFHPGRSIGSQSAVMVLDLSGQAEATDLWVDFWAKRNWTSATYGQFYVELSGDGQAYHQIASFDPPPYDPPRPSYKQYTFDLDQHARDAGVALDGDVYVRFRHYNDEDWTSQIVYLDDVRILKEARVFGRYVFYNNSCFDGNDPAPNEQDDLAIATDKTALMLGETAGFANYTSYDKGINGIMVDIAGLASTTLTGDDFEFRLGNDNDPDGWSTIDLTRPPDVRPGDGENGSDRVTLTWGDNAIPTRNWLEVRVNATENTGLARDEVFYFGNAIGDADGDRVAACADMYAVYQQLGQPATVDNPLDIDRDGIIAQADMDAVFPQIARLPVLNLITVPSVVATDEAAATDEDTTEVIDVLANDRDVDGNPLSVAAWDGTSVSGASVTVNPDGTLTYDPSGSPTLQALAAGEIMEDTFSYMISDIRGGTDTRTVTVTISGVDEPEGGGGAESFGMGAQADESVPLAMNLGTGEDAAGSDQRSVHDGIFAAGGLPVGAGARDPLAAPVPWLPEEAALWFVDDWGRFRGPRSKPQQAGQLPRWRPADDGPLPPAVNFKGRANAARMNKASARDAVLQESALRDSESPETPLGESAWMWLYEFEFEQIRARKPSSNNGNLVGEAVDGLLAAGWK